MVANPDEMFAPSGGRLVTTTLPEAWVVKWIDYSSKYGVGYVLSNGRIGVYFNDATKMVFSTSSNSRTVEYLFRQKGDKVDTVKLYSLEDDTLAGDAKKKTTLIKNFKGYLQTNNEKEGCTRGTSSFSLFGSGSGDDQMGASSSTLPLHVKRWMRTKHALVFQLSNKVWQVIFQDKTEVILSAQTHLCHYMAGSSPNGQSGITVYPLGSIGDVTDEYVAKRLAYSKQVVIHMLGGATASGNGGGGHTNDIGQ
jgi:polo-like kinase 1